MSQGDVLDDRKAKPSARLRSRPIGLEESFPDSVDIRFRYSLAIVRDSKRRLSGRLRDSHLNPASLGRVVDGVCHQVDQRLSLIHI